MQFTPFSQDCGVLVEDVQLASCKDEDIVRLQQAFAEHGLLFFRGQVFPPEEHLRFAKRFGDIVVNKFFKQVEGHPQIAEVRKEKDQQMNIGGGWHTDHSYDEDPAKGSILVARQLPAAGGNTRFANLAAAYQTLPDDIKEKISTLNARHSNVHIYGEGGMYRMTDLSTQLGGMDRVGDAVHPVVIKHPDSGKPVLYVNPGHTVGIEGMETEEGFALLNTLYTHVTKSGLECSFNWEPGSVAIWDNRSTWHNADNDYHGESRLMHRITLAGSLLERY